jgi:hypothetical protein
MTRILLTLVLIFSISFIVSAQFKKNDILLGGQLSYSYYSTNQTVTNSPGYPQNDQKQNNGNITISAGKALNETTVLGVTLSYLPVSSKSYYSNGVGPLNYRDNGFSAGIFYRKYKTLGKEFYLFGQIAAFYNWSNQTGKDSAGVTILTGSGWGAGINLYPGIAYRISKHFFLELTIPDLFLAQYNKLKSVSQENIVSSFGTSQSDQFTISSSLSSNPLMGLGIGFRLIL